MINSKKIFSCTVNIMSSSVFNIVLYFKMIFEGLLNYYKRVDDFYKMNNIVNWFIGYSAILTLKHKRK